LAAQDKVGVWLLLVRSIVVAASFVLAPRPQYAGRVRHGWLGLTHPLGEAIVGIPGHAYHGVQGEEHRECKREHGGGQGREFDYVVFCIFLHQNSWVETRPFRVRYLKSLFEAPRPKGTGIPASTTV